MKLTFLMQINIKFPTSWFQHFGHQSFLQGDRHDHENVKGVVMGMISILKVLKVTSLQCLYNISKKKLWMEFILEFIKIKTSASWIIDFWWKPDMSKQPKKRRVLRHVQTTQKKKGVKGLQYTSKKYCNCFCVLF